MFMNTYTVHLEVDVEKRKQNENEYGVMLLADDLNLVANDPTVLLDMM